VVGAVVVVVVLVVVLVEVVEDVDASVESEPSLVVAASGVQAIRRASRSGRRGTR